MEGAGGPGRAVEFCDNVEEEVGGEDAGVWQEEESEEGAEEGAAAGAGLLSSVIFCINM